MSREQPLAEFAATAPPTALSNPTMVLEAIRALFPPLSRPPRGGIAGAARGERALGYVPPQAVIEVAELLGLAPAEVQDTLSFYGFFKQDSPQGRTAFGSAARSVARPAAARNC